MKREDKLPFTAQPGQKSAEEAGNSNVGFLIRRECYVSQVIE